MKTILDHINLAITLGIPVENIIGADMRENNSARIVFKLNPEMELNKLPPDYGIQFPFDNNIGIMSYNPS